MGGRRAGRKWGVVEQGVVASARGRFVQHPAVQYGVAQLGDSSRPRAVASVVEDIGLSQRRFIEIFRNEVGVTPKAFSRIQRFQHVLGSVEHANEVDWTSVACA